MRNCKNLFGVLAAGLICSIAAIPVHAQATQEKALLGVGDEDLPGYGRLTFRFLPAQIVKMTDNDATERSVSFRPVEMTDKDGIQWGTWHFNGDQVQLFFYDDTVVYRGTIKGNRVSGTATNGRVTWNWSVKLQDRGTQRR
jgi:hypothetical protein